MIDRRVDAFVQTDVVENDEEWHGIENPNKNQKSFLYSISILIIFVVIVYVYYI